MQLEIITGDITRQDDIDVIVNAANSSLLGGGGVDGAIHRAAGRKLAEECRYLGGCKTGEAKITRGWDLPNAHVVHTVGPVWRGGGYGEEDLLESCHVRSVQLAGEAVARSIAFPAISCGRFGYPTDLAALTAIGSAVAAAHDEGLDLVRFVLFDDATRQIFQDAADSL